MTNDILLVIGGVRNYGNMQIQIYVKSQYKEHNRIQYNKISRASLRKSPRSDAIDDSQTVCSIQRKGLN